MYECDGMILTKYVCKQTCVQFTKDNNQSETLIQCHGIYTVQGTQGHNVIRYIVIMSSCYSDSQYMIRKMGKRDTVVYRLLGKNFVLNI